MPAKSSTHKPFGTWFEIRNEKGIELCEIINGMVGSSLTINSQQDESGKNQQLLVFVCEYRKQSELNQT